MPSLIEMKAAAYDAHVAAQQAQAAAASAQEQAAKAAAAVQSLTGAATPAPAPVAVTPAPTPAPVAPAPAPAPAPAATPPPATADASQAEVQRALEKAEQAAAEARRTRAELDELKEERRMRYARRGLTVSAGAFYAPQIFDIRANVDNSKGLYGGIGYRIHPRFSIDSNFNWVQGFATDWTSLTADATTVTYSGDLTMWSATIGGRVYLLTRKIQPYLGFGFGATGAKGTFTAAGAPDIDYKEFSGNISFNGGIELYVSESLALGADAAIYLPGGDLAGLTYSTLGGKLIYRF